MYKRIIALCVSLILLSVMPAFAAESTNEQSVQVKAPTNLIATDVRTDLMYFSFGFDRTDKNYDSCEVQYATQSNYSGAKTVILKRQDHVYAGNLKPNSPLYVRARYMKDGVAVSPYATAVFRTASNVPSTSPSNTVTKAITARMKKGKSFTYAFPAKYDPYDAEWYITYIQYGLPQYDYYNVQIIEKDELATHVKMTYNKSKATKAKKVRTQMNKIIKKAKKKKGTKAKVTYINQQLCKRASYDYTAARSSNSKYAYAHEPYGCLVKRKAVCDGYAKSFYAITRALKIPSALVFGDAHAWNKVKISGKWYYVDSSQNDLGHRYTKNVWKSTHIMEKSIFKILY